LSFYPADLAQIHDEGFGDFARSAACELLPRLPARGLVVELGCGSGISSEIICDTGYDVLGIDIAPDMLAIARRRAPRADFRESSIWDAELPPCVAVTAIGEVVNYAADERAGAERLPELFRRIRGALPPRGLLLFDFATPGRASGRIHVQEGDGWRIESRTIEADGILERLMTIEAGGHVRREVHRLRLYDAGMVEGHLREAGFAPERLDHYCDFVFWPGYAAFAATSVR
jgi:SAM-dependent methyltransferase